MTSQLSESPRIEAVTIVGRGRLGRAVARALRDAGIAVTGPTLRGEPVPPADAVLLCVPDAEIAAAAEAVGGDSLIGHMSGATPLDGSRVDFGVHPLQTFTGTEGAAAFQGIGCAVAGRSPQSLAVARHLAYRLGMHPFVLDDDRRAAYHAAASLASNFVVTVLDASERVAAAAGLAPADARTLLAPLVWSTVRNWAADGPEVALTGPIVRGDALTVARQREAIASQSPEVLALFDALIESTRSLAARGRAA